MTRKLASELTTGDRVVDGRGVATVDGVTDGATLLAEGDSEGITADDVVVTYEERSLDVYRQTDVVEVEDAPFPVAGPPFVDTPLVCPGCGQHITVVLDDSYGTPSYTECGGEGNGGCDVWIGGDPACEAQHRAAMQGAW
jgi:hypothetical protein